MAKRTAFIVMLGAFSLLGASFSLQAEVALANGSNEASLAQIEAIEDAATVQIGAAESQVAQGLETATSVGEAKSIRDAGLDTIDATYWSAVDDIHSVAEDADFDEEVTSAGWVAQVSLEAEATAAAAAVTAYYDSWYTVWMAWSTEDVIWEIDWTLAFGLNKIDVIVRVLVDDFEDDEVETIEEADEERQEALADLAERVSLTTDELDGHLAIRPADPAVQAAHASAMNDLVAAAEAAAATIEATHAAWVAENTAPATTTTTTVSTTTTTTTTVPKATTTTTAPTTTTTTTTLPPPATTTTTTTTTLPAPAALPPTPPPPMPISETAFMSDTPVRPVQVSTASSAEAFEGDSEMSTVGFVTRIVDSQLPAGVSTVAAGPLVVLGLVVDAIRAAGTLMVVPWIVLIVYMLGLLRERRLSVETAL